MNIFSAFTFGSLIKTFIPGFVWLIALAVLDADLSHLFKVVPHVLTFWSAHDQAALILAIPAAVLLGLLSNILVFMGANDWIVRDPVRRQHAELFRLQASLSKIFRDKYWPAASLTDPSLRARFDQHVDAEILMLQVCGLSNVVYVREQYWFHLEFQINLLVSFLALLFVMWISAIINMTDPETLILGSVFLFMMGVGARALLIPAARKNFLRHTEKILSLMAAAIAMEAGKPAR